MDKEQLIIHLNDIIKLTKLIENYAIYFTSRDLDMIEYQRRLFIILRDQIKKG